MTRRPTLEDVAARAGVSRALASLGLKDSSRVAAATRARIRSAADDLGYLPNLAARNLASHRTGTIGVLLNDLHNPFFAEVFDGIAAAAEGLDLQWVLTTARDVRSNEQRSIDALLAHRVDGVILVSTRLPATAAAAVAKSGPTVVVGRSMRSVMVDCVLTDDAAGCRLVVDHLVGLGHERIAHIDGGPGAGATARRRGFEGAMKRAGLADRATIVSGDFTEAAGVQGAQRLFRGRSRPTAVFAANDLVALGVLDHLGSSGVSVPDHVSVMGYDNTAVSRLTTVSLTTVDQSSPLLGSTAVAVLMDRLGGRTQQRIELLEPTLMQRQTTAPPPER
jgi:DNA-binding LacI/PurR family transcriptional regulator